MKFTDVCFKVYRRDAKLKIINLENYIFDYRRDQFLKNKVSSQGEKWQRAVCVQEMMTMLACIKRTDYDQSPCQKEIKLFETCVATQEAERKKMKELMKSGSAVDEMAKQKGRLSSREVNMLLRSMHTSENSLPLIKDEDAMQLCVLWACLQRTTDEAKKQRLRQLIFQKALQFISKAVENRNEAERDEPFMNLLSQKSDVLNIERGFLTGSLMQRPYSVFIGEWGNEIAEAIRRIQAATMGRSGNVEFVDKPQLVDAELDDILLAKFLSSNNATESESAECDPLLFDISSKPSTSSAMSYSQHLRNIHVEVSNEEQEHDVQPLLSPNWEENVKEEVVSSPPPVSDTVDHPGENVFQEEEEDPEWFHFKVEEDTAPPVDVVFTRELFPELDGSYGEQNGMMDVLDVMPPVQAEESHQEMQLSESEVLDLCVIPSPTLSLEDLDFSDLFNLTLPTPMQRQSSLEVETQLPTVKLESTTSPVVSLGNAENEDVKPPVTSTPTPTITTAIPSSSSSIRRKQALRPVQTLLETVEVKQNSTVKSEKLDYMFTAAEDVDSGTEARDTLEDDGEDTDDAGAGDSDSFSSLSRNGERIRVDSGSSSAILQSPWGGSSRQSSSSTSDIYGMTASKKKKRGSRAQVDVPSMSVPVSGSSSSGTAVGLGEARSHRQLEQAGILALGLDLSTVLHVGRQEFVRLCTSYRLTQVQVQVLQQVRKRAAQRKASFRLRHKLSQEEQNRETQLQSAKRRLAELKAALEQKQLERNDERANLARLSQRLLQLCHDWNYEPLVSSGGPRGGSQRGVASVPLSSWSVGVQVEDQRVMLQRRVHPEEEEHLVASLARMHLRQPQAGSTTTSTSPSAAHSSNCSYQAVREQQPSSDALYHSSTSMESLVEC